MKRMTAYAAALLIAGFAMFVSVAHAEAPGVPVTLNGYSAIDGDDLTITGETSAPDGAWLIFATYSVETPRIRKRSYMLVKHGRFSAQVNIHGWPTGEIETDIHFQTMLPEREQPAIVFQKYGAKGERMTGKTVVQQGESYRAAVIELRAYNP